MKKIFVQLLMVLSILSLFGCSSSEGKLKFSEIVKDDLSKISSRNSGSGLFYSTTNKEIIAHFVNTMSATTYSKTGPYEPVTGNSSLGLYNEENERITFITSNGDGVFAIGDGFYKMNEDINDELSSFYKELYSDSNLIKE
ncbi:hypothetical protein PaecuDRAFT_0830 [Paenibacillus curdlanolyticus YK9]|uniref:Lipoprotein n=1 Tax=Paenibacillus curdlanolyticus YK9 TaxID=717606 RepID=E0I5A8_9BACL|nr:hypothetical protein [Paenibacillus curdlanolyticus]EFM12150.1 hypothetical protein PaecuDRAFT_0830 [Paenibacillus curdlanolyticus YK9]